MAKPVLNQIYYPENYVNCEMQIIRIEFGYYNLM